MGIQTIPDSTAVATVTHNLGFTPIVFAFMETAGSLLNLQNFPTFGFDTTNNDIFGIQELVYGADKTTVGFALNDAGSLTIAYNIKYYLYRLRIN